ncbi:NADP-dependent oxidoreductase domain-containing protein [Paraphoma chrysanthemicola]|uniref:NADP-dependent oxidoreductase domain-containing protein n=1 Tax=Paraphoma chrysanthemicola TaxID=798071 RepID=A0A8K0QZC1_9PLEO|nr:NADP-dependent oxidoreductase domain-containing protein [Paraphoma chrysanthemicola]
MPSTQLPIIFGAMTFGREGEEQVRTSNLSDCAGILDVFQSHGHNEIDTSRFYGVPNPLDSFPNRLTNNLEQGGTSEQYLGQLDWQSRGLVMDTKFFPNALGWLGRPTAHLIPSDMHEYLDESLKQLKTDKVDLWYLHAPDRTVPIEETLKGVNELYKEGKFRIWGVSNFMAWEVAALCEICKKEGYPLPTVYQGIYNAFHRTIEIELLPCLRKYNIAFYAYNPLAGGWLTGRYARDLDNAALEPGSRFDANRWQGKMYRARWWKDEFFTALEGLREVKGELRESEVALRWMMHHSLLKRELGDKVIIGASSKEQLEMNLTDFEKGPLDEGLLRALDKGWEGARGITWKYFH